MSLTDVTYFDTVFLSIPNGSFDNRQDFIDHYEPLIVNEIFGYELGKLILAYDSGTSEQRIKDIVEGKEYTNNDDILTKWIGLLNDDKRSLISNYVYYWWMRTTATDTSNNGEIKVLNENSNNTTPAMKLDKVWTDFVEMCNELLCFMYEFEDDYPEWVDPARTTERVNAFDL